MQETTPSEDKAFERREHVLHAYYERLDNLDKSIRELTSFFFGINTAILALAFQVVKDDLQRLILALIGYCVSIAIYLITYKSFLSWKLYAQDMNEIEDELDYDISKKYDARLERTSGKTIRVTLVRMRFNFLFIVLWLGILSYLLYRLSASCWFGSPLWLTVFLTVLLMTAIVYLPWAYFAGTMRPRSIWATLCALWAREV
jgi:magnesium-transporting ATPase (P-type)